MPDDRAIVNYEMEMTEKKKGRDLFTTSVLP